MQRVLLQSILDHISAELPQFKTVDLFNDQFNKQDNGVIDSFRFPALFISFPDGANFSAYTAGVQQSTDLTVRFYIGYELIKTRSGINKSVLDLMDLKQKVFEKFHGFSAPFIQTFSRVYEEGDEDRKNYYIYIQDYKSGVIDSSKYIDRDQDREATLTLDLTKEVIINPVTDNGIRTAKDVNDI
tara:strand:- start:189 stop:743 length:555 start_codon:yes stop_codon:yes gene_type:complete